ncbi:restriction endonuclease subunit S [Dechloromonas sp. HYN0024]|uniref:restriction endonuclease subunit S n=1 Tax=Dechloromonas sp. HYN0024 TaxID=2231055 RepID=UPI001F078C4F|nr:restriction endonuclease subunit S [Dechloromonas sp. HYN0024]
MLKACEPSAHYLAALELPLLGQFDLIARAPNGVARLRELILSLAVQGKLVPHNVNDEPASVVLENIRAEKERLLKEGKIRADKPLAAIDDEEAPFPLPLAWEWERLGHVVGVIRGITFPANKKTKEPAEGRIGCLRTANVQDRIEWDDLLFIDRSFMGREEQIVQCSDIVMSMANSRELVGKVAIVTEIPVVEATIGGFLSVLRPRSILPQFLMIVLRTEYARSMLIDSASQTTNIANISLRKLNPLPIPVPPIDQQSRIVARVDELMTLCDALETKGKLEAEQHARLVSSLFETLVNSESAHALSENWRYIAIYFDLLLDRPAAVGALEQTIFQLAVRGLLVPQDPSDEPASALLQKIRNEKERLVAAGKIKRDKPLPPIRDEDKPFELPQGWEWARFPELGEFGRGKSKHRPRNDPRLFNSGKYPLVQTGEVARADQVISEYYSKYSEKGLAQSKMWPKGTLCITIAANIADTAILGFDACFPDSVVGFVPSPIIGNTEYFLAFMATARKRLLEFAPATAQKNINLKILSSVLIPIPPAREMKEIVSCITQFRALCADLSQRLGLIQQTQSRLTDALVESVVA